MPRTSDAVPDAFARVEQHRWWGELRADPLRVRAGEDEGRCELGCVLGWMRVGGNWHEVCTLECFVVLRVRVCLCVCVTVSVCTLPMVMRGFAHVCLRGGTRGRLAEHAESPREPCKDGKG